MRDNMDDLKDKNALDAASPAANADTAGPSQNEPQYSLNDDRRVKVLSPGAMVAKRFFRNGVAVFGMVVLIFMFVFSFIGGIISPYAQDEKFFTTEYQLKEYAGVSRNDEFRFAAADGQDFGGAVQAKVILAVSQNASSFQYRDATYTVTEEGRNFYSVSLGDTVIGIAFKDIVSMSTEGAAVSFDFRFNALKAYTNDESSFQADGKTYRLDSDGVMSEGGSEVGFISQYVVQSVMPDIFLTRDFKEKVVEAVESGITEFIYTSEEGEHEYVISYDPAAKVWSVRQETETYVFDTYSSPSK